jgi:hypothetical protein
MAEPKIVPARAVIDPEKRKRRLSRVSTILLGLAALQEAAEQESACIKCSAAVEGPLVAQEYDECHSQQTWAWTASTPA